MIVVSELRQRFPLKVLLKVACLSRSTYYYHRSKKDKDEKNKDLMQLIAEIFHEHKGRYGFRRITLALHNKGFLVNKKKVRRLMDKLGLKGKRPKISYHSYKGDMNSTTKNQLLDKVVDEEKHKTYYERNFSTSSCNEKWTTDVSLFRIPAGTLYLSPILDMHNREIVAYNISRSPNYAQIQDMLKKAFEQHDDLEGLIFHSDQGWQYQMQAYRQSLAERHIIQSMSRKGNCLDNSPMENFFGIMKNEMFYGHESEFKTLDELRHAMEEYIVYYNTKRITEKLKGSTPVEYRCQSLKNQVI